MILEAIAIATIPFLMAIGLVILVAPRTCELVVANALMSYKDWRGKAERERMRIR